MSTDAHKVARAVTLRIGGGRWDDDVYSAALLGCVVAADTYDEQRGAALGTWMRTCARREVVDLLRSRRMLFGFGRGDAAERAVYVESDHAGDLNAGGAAAVAADASTCCAWLGLLPPRECELLTRHYLRGEPLGQAGRAIGYAQRPHVSRVHRRALGRLREWAAVGPPREPMCESQPLRADAGTPAPHGGGVAP